MHTKEKIRSLLAPFITTTAVADIYSSLITYGSQTISQLSRSSGVERTRIYRSLHELQALYLVEIELQPHRQIVHAAPLENLHTVIQKRQTQLQQADEYIQAFQQELQQQVGSQKHATRVQFYSGKSGIEQMVWNQTKASGEVLSILSENLQSHVDKAFFERWVDRCNEKGIHTRSLVDANFLAAQKAFYGDEKEHSLKNWHARVLPKQESAIAHRTTVYDDVTTYFSWQDGDAHGIELYSKDIADAQRQYFDLLWRQSAAL